MGGDFEKHPLLSMPRGLRISAKACLFNALRSVVTKKLIIAVNSCLDRYFYALIFGFFFIFLVSVQNLRKFTL